MASTPDGFKVVKLIVSDACYERLNEMREDAPVRTFTSMLAPVVIAYSRGEIQQQFVQTRPPVPAPKPPGQK
ncbi:hypothetical protein [Hymenobacter lapidiphilus]|uniref:Uncharacterized protein n=1 Tax=Hymenobacter lapidiphilus TaxID=2608003 RepID=A0A7Y7PSR9_9BACT|nr:hypothetical protein [Hymenobacter lapidiphilus]NVO33275.1 hypothetical protein [Hymenobacter lapidiphilus]